MSRLGQPWCSPSSGHALSLPPPSNSFCDEQLRRADLAENSSLFFLAGRDFYWISTSSWAQIVCQSMCASVGEAREGAVGHTKDGRTPALFLCCWKSLAAAAYWCYAGAAKWPDSSALTGTQQRSHAPSRLTLKALVSLAGGRWLAWRCVAARPGAAGPTSLGQTHRCIR